MVIPAVAEPERTGNGCRDKPLQQKQRHGQQQHGKQLLDKDHPGAGFRQYLPPKIPISSRGNPIPRLSKKSVAAPYSGLPFWAIYSNTPDNGALVQGDPIRPTMHRAWPHPAAIAATADWPGYSVYSTADGSCIPFPNIRLSASNR